MVTPTLVVALDQDARSDAEALVRLLGPFVSWFKIGSILFTRAGPDAVRMVHEAGKRVFLDLKFHDIPQTVAGGVAAAAGLGVALVTVHCAAGAEALRAAAGARPAGSPLRILGVTRLTSDAGRVGARVLRAAVAARDAGLDGVTASARDCARIKAVCGLDFRVLTPGIRPAEAAAGDQVRIATPRQAVRAGADYLVVGRPITAAADPVAAARGVLDEMDRAVARRGTQALVSATRTP
ncbi:MAG TPA: orotidine-5'-phosphate decarboxylase [bacterium]|nr:orotidine-5'-phosphate decarboxylase [bacterium]